jgi:hypothetical protein
MVDVTEISAVVTAAGVLVGVVYYILEIRHQSRLRQTESVTRLSPYFNMNAREMQEAITQVCSIEYENYKDYLKKYSGRPQDTTLKILGNYFEGIGILVDKKLVGADIVYNFWGDIIVSSWDKIHPLVVDMRKDDGDPNLFLFFEHLYNEMKIREQKLQPKP